MKNPSADKLYINLSSWLEEVKTEEGEQTQQNLYRACRNYGMDGNSGKEEHITSLKG